MCSCACQGERWHVTLLAHDVGNTCNVGDIWAAKTCCWHIQCCHNVPAYAAAWLVSCLFHLARLEQLSAGCSVSHTAQKQHWTLFVFASRFLYLLSAACVCCLLVQWQGVYYVSGQVVNTLPSNKHKADTNSSNSCCCFYGLYLCLHV